MIRAHNYRTLHHAIVAAQDEAAQRGGCDLEIDGTLPVWGTPTITKHKVYVVGQRGALLRLMTPNSQGLHFNYPADQWHGTGGGVFDLTMEAGVGWSEGNRGNGAEGAAIKVTHAASNFHIERVDLTNFGTGIALERCWYVKVRSFRVLFAKWAGLQILTNADGEAGGGNNFSDGEISNNGYEGASENPPGIKIVASGGEYFDTVDTTCMHNGVLLKPESPEHELLNIFMRRVLGDTAKSDGFLIDGTVGSVRSVHLLECWGSGSDKGCGHHIRGGGVDTVTMANGCARENHQHGYWTEKVNGQGPRNVVIDGNEIATNSAVHPESPAHPDNDGEPGVYSGVHTGGCADITVRNNAPVGNTGSKLVPSQKFGIEGPAGGGPYPNIGPNTFVGNLSGDMHL